MDKAEDNCEDVACGLPTMFGCGYWSVFVALFAVILGLVVWSFAGRIGEDVHGAGIVLGRGTYVGISATGDGVLVVLDVQPGDEVVYGQVVGRVYSIQDYAALRCARTLMEHHRKVYEENRTRVEAMRKAREAYSKDELARLDASLERQRKQLEWYRDFVKKFPALAKSGAVSQFEASDAQDRLDKRLLAIDTDAAARLSESFKCLDEVFSLEHGLFDDEIAAERARATVAELENRTLVNGRVISRCCGRVVNVNVDAGDYVRAGQELVRVSTTGTEGGVWELDAYFPAVDAKKIVPGMTALVTPSTVKVEQDGSIRGFVASVGEALETRESLERTFRSAGFAEAVERNCKAVPLRVRVVLMRDPSTPSGFAWTSGKGPDQPISHGTFASVSVRTCSHTPMNILLGRIRRGVFGDGIMERDRVRHEIRTKEAAK